jgi:hypothetical protein
MLNVLPFFFLDMLNLMSKINLITNIYLFLNHSRVMALDIEWDDNVAGLLLPGLFKGGSIDSKLGHCSN